MDEEKPIADSGSGSELRVLGRCYARAEKDACDAACVYHLQRCVSVVALPKLSRRI